MKFRKIEFNNHPILGTTSFDFTDEQGKTVDTIIIAGENGCGKSYLLSFLNTYNPGFSARDLGYTMRVEVEFSDDDIRLLLQDKNFNNVVGKRLAGNIVTFIHDTTFNDDNTRVEFSTIEGGKVIGYAFYFASNPRVFTTVFSDVEINFTPRSIQHTTSSKLDEKIGGPIRSSDSLATQISQLLVDINELDNEDLAKWVDLHKGVAPTEDVLHTRIRRFTESFNTIFPHKRFAGIDNIDNRKVVLFEEFGKQMEIGQLSSGEKQIVFRGGFLLRNLGTINGATILVDEPELSLHPQWQLKILNFLKGLFTDGEGKQTSQLIVATHSPFILHNDTRADDKVIVMSKNEKGEIEILDKPEFFNWSSSSAVEEAFHVRPLLADKDLIVFLEGETDEMYFNKALEVFGIDDTKLKFNWIGHYVGVNRDKAENTGVSALNGAAAFFKANPMMIIDKKVYLLYDCDTNKPESQDGNLFVGAMTKNVTANKYKIGVENLLALPDDFDYAKYYKTSNSTDKYGAPCQFSSLDKIALAKSIIDMPNETLCEVLKNIKVEIDKILSITGI